MTNSKNTITKVLAQKEVSRNLMLEFAIGLPPDDAIVHVDSGAIVPDLQPRLSDAVAIEIQTLGHHEDIPKPWDWENLLTMLKPGEELLYILDHQLEDNAGHTTSPLTVWLGIRFPDMGRLSTDVLRERTQRARVLLAQIHRQSFPDTSYKPIPATELCTRMRYEVSGHSCVAVTGMPSPRTLKDEETELNRNELKRNYQSLNALIEPLSTLEQNYRIAFVVQRTADWEVQQELVDKTSLYDSIYPLIEQTARQGTGKSISHGITQSSTSTRGGNRSRTSGSSSTSGDTKSDSTSKAMPSTMVGATVGAVVGGLLGAIAGPAGSVVGASIGSSLGSAVGGLKGTSKTTSSGTSRSHSSNQSRTEGISWSTASTRGTSETSSDSISHDLSVQQVNSMLKLGAESIERSMRALNDARGTGGYRWSAFVFSQGVNTNTIAQSLKGVLNGSRTKDQPLISVELMGDTSNLLANRISPLTYINPAVPILSLPHVRNALLLPDAELPGLSLRRNVFFGRTTKLPPTEDDVFVDVGADSFMAHQQGGVNKRIYISSKDLFRHTLVAGTTGAGKTVRTVEFLNKLRVPELSVIVLETAKRTYRGKYQPRDHQKAPLVYQLGSSTNHGPDSRFKPLRINPFYFERGTSLKRHIAVLTDAITELLPTEAMIGPLLQEAIEQCYLVRNWDIEQGLPIDGAKPTWPTIVDFVQTVREIADNLNYGPEVNANYRGALQSRANVFLNPSYQDIFGYGGNTCIDELFPEDRSSIIEVEDLPPSSIDVRAFVCTLLFSRLRAVQESRSHLIDSRTKDFFEGSEILDTERDFIRKQRKWLLVIEEAHNILDRANEIQRAQEEANGGRTLLNTTLRLLREGREIEIGTLIIDQSPVKLSQDVIANTGTKIIMRLEDANEMKEVGQAMGLEEHEWRKFGDLAPGEAIIKASYMNKPTKSSADDMAELTLPPQTKHPREEDPENYSPWFTNYQEITQHWNRVLDGSRQKADTKWLDRLKDLTNDQPALAVFVAARDLLKNQGQNEQAIEIFGELLARYDISFYDIHRQALAIGEVQLQTIYAPIYDKLLGVLCAELSQSDLWKSAHLSSSEVEWAAKTLSKAKGVSTVSESIWARGLNEVNDPFTIERSTLLKISLRPSHIAYLLLTSPTSEAFSSKQELSNSLRRYLFRLLKDDATNKVDFKMKVLPLVQRINESALRLAPEESHPSLRCP